MFKFINNESKTIVGAATIVGVLSFVSRMIGLVRDRILAGEFGAGDTLDVYYAAFKLPDLIFSLIVIGALSASFIPLFVKYFHKPMGKDRAWELTNNTLHIVAIGMLAVSVVVFLAAGPLATVIAPGFSVPKQQDVAEFTRIMLLAQIILSVSVVYGSALQGMKRFLLYSLAPVMYNIGIIVGAVWFTKIDALGTTGLAWGVVFGAFLHFLVQLYGVLQAGYKYRWVFDPKDKDVRAILMLAGPRMLGIGVNQLNVLILTIIATTLAVGSVTVFQFAYNIQFFAVGIIGVSYAIAVFPTFSEELAAGNTARFQKTFSSTVRQVLFFMIPAMVLFLIVRAQIVRVVVGAGEFDWTATILTADTLAFFTLSFVAQALVFILARAFFALHDTVTPLTAGIAATVLGVVSALWLSDDFGVIGLAMAYSISSIMNAALLWVPLRQKIGSLDEERIIRSLFVISSAGIVCAFVMQLLKPVSVQLFPLTTFSGVFLQGLFAGGLGLLVYVLIARLFKSEELEMVWNGVKRRFWRRATPEEAIGSESPTAS